MRPSKVASALRTLSSRIDGHRGPVGRGSATRGLRKVLAAIGGQMLTLQYVTPPQVEDDGTLASEFEELVSGAGGSVEGWEGDAIRIVVADQNSRPDVLELLSQIRSGAHGASLQQLISPYLEGEIEVSEMDDSGTWTPTGETTGA